MRRPERADSRTARVAMEGARGAAVNIERVGNAIAAVRAGISRYRGLDAGCDVKFREGLEALARSMSPPPNAGQVLTVLLSGSSQAGA